MSNLLEVRIAKAINTQVYSLMCLGSSDKNFLSQCIILLAHKSNIGVYKKKMKKTMGVASYFCSLLNCSKKFVNFSTWLLKLVAQVSL